MSDLDRFKQTYFLECAELLDTLEEQLSSAEADGASAETANAVFRAVHSIKGGAGAFGFDALVGFAHYFETVLDKVREGEIAFTQQVIGICLRCSDALADLVAAARDGGEADAASVERARTELDSINTGGSGSSSDTPSLGEDFDDLDFTPVAVGGDPAEEGATTSVWRIRFRPFPSLLERGVEPALIFRELAEQGELNTVCDASQTPGLDAYEPSEVYVSWELTLTGDTTREAIEEAFDFAIGDCELEIECVDGAIQSPPVDEGAPAPSLDDLLSAALGDAPQADQTQADGEAPEPKETPHAPATPKPRAPAPAETKADDARMAVPQTIRVDLDRVDRVSDMASELVITQASLIQQIDDQLKQALPDLARGLEVLSQQTRSLQDAIMSIRAQPVKSVFSRMPRLIRQLEDDTGKKVRLEMRGEGTEIDKTIVEQLADPLTHMIRNAVDHGIETPDQRVADGKPAEGVITLSAEQISGRIVIRIQDDGQGVRRDKVYAKAVDRGLVAADAQLADDEIDQLIFMPGFSTAETASNISGRGVGMDVVRENILRLGGRVSIKSVEGKGATIILSLPLTLAVLDVMVVRVGDNPYVLPLASVIESMTYQDARISRLPSGENVVNFRNEFVQIADLAVMLSENPKPDDQRFLIMCDAEGERRIGLVVDAMSGQQQVAIKSLEANFARIDGLAGATIMGDGQVALILDVVGIQRLLTGGRVREGALAA